MSTVRAASNTVVLSWLAIMKPTSSDGFAKSPSVPRGAGLRFIFRHCGVRLCTPHSSRFARLFPPAAGELFTVPSTLATSYEVLFVWFRVAVAFADLPLASLIRLDGDTATLLFGFLGNHYLQHAIGQLGGDGIVLDFAGQGDAPPEGAIATFCLEVSHLVPAMGRLSLALQDETAFVDGQGKVLAPHAGQLRQDNNLRVGFVKINLGLPLGQTLGALICLFHRSFALTKNSFHLLAHG